MDARVEPAIPHRDAPDPVKGALAGAVAGAAGAFVMERFQTDALPKIKERFGADGGGSEASDSSDPATVKAADKVLAATRGRHLEDDEKPVAGELAHYAMGVVSGILYGVAAEYAPRATAGHGAAFGAAVWAVADEAVVPALGLSDPPWEHPPETHAYALASHLVYGVTTETVRRALRDAL